MDVAPIVVGAISSRACAGDGQLAAPNRRRAFGLDQIAGKHLQCVALSVSIALLFADQNLMAPNLTQIAEEFGYNDVERDIYLGGYTTISFFVVGAPVSVLVGYLGDRMHRMNLFVVNVFLGETSCLLTAFIGRGDLAQLLVCRALTGIAVGGAMPLVYSVLADIYPPHMRAVVSSCMIICQGAGIIFGQALAGMVGPSAGWRLPFVLVAVPSFIMAVVVRVVIKEPCRGAADAPLGAPDAAAKISWRKVGDLFLVRSNLLLLAQGCFGCIPWGVMLVYFNDYLAIDKGLGVQRATLAILFFGVGTFPGSVIGGYMGQHVYSRRPALLPVACALSICLGAVLGVILTTSDFGSDPGGLTFALIYLALAFKGFVVTLPAASIKMFALNVNVPEVRGTAIGMFSQIDDVGKSLGPLLVSALIGGAGRLRAFTLAWAAWPICAFFIWLMTFTIELDASRVSQPRAVLESSALPTHSEPR